MAEIAQIYLGNVHRDSDLAELIAAKSCWRVALDRSDRAKGRIHTHTDDGTAIGIIKNRARLMQDGDVFQTKSQKLVLIHLHQQEVLVLDFSALDDNISPATLVNLGHTLGNRHYSIKLKESRIYIQLESDADKEIIGKIVEEVSIAGLQVLYESYSSSEAVIFPTHHH